ncbi:MotA/TolQ/ExbB proton channel family protein [Azovibrio restrictus]|uniref:MotA/TolQ/ExbB proton channel family protein n=1 Tax=Azovibrio restrictus TaxID=146938 RepID=UPI0026EF0E6C|nr:MotA/TolQ/ExbB proton channel family protein [Azovibrio restrictus]
MNPSLPNPAAVSGFDIASVWAQGDAVSHAVAIVLLLMSVASWAIILGKAWSVWQLRQKTPGALESFWDSSSVSSGLDKLASLKPFHDMAAQGQGAIRHLESHQREGGHLDAHLPASELVTRALRNSIARTTSRLEGGLTLLASVGSTAPFVGLFGTVWGIYHALARIGATGQASLDKVAGPVGEALIMTAAGLFVAIPAVLAYNAFTRSLRLITADMEAFAHDLHAYFTIGHPLPTSQGSSKLRPVSVAVAANGAA